MQLQHVLPTPLVAGVEPSFVVTLASDAGAMFNMLVTGRHLERPLDFATFAAEQTGSPCSSPVGSDVGAWHSYLGQVLARQPGVGPSSNAPSSVEFSGCQMDAERRRSLLAASQLGKAIPAEAPAEPVTMAAPDTRSEHEQFIARCQKAEADARHARIVGLSSSLERTGVGRDVLAQQGIR